MWLYAISKLGMNLRNSHPDKISPQIKEVFISNRNGMLACKDLESAVKITACLKAINRPTPHADPITPIIFQINTADIHGDVMHEKQLAARDILNYVDSEKAWPRFFKKEIVFNSYSREINPVVGIQTYHLSQLKIYRDVHAAYYLDSSERLVRHDLRFSWWNLAVNCAELSTGTVGYYVLFCLCLHLFPTSVPTDLIEKLNNGILTSDHPFFEATFTPSVDPACHFLSTNSPQCGPINPPKPDLFPAISSYALMPLTGMLFSTFKFLRYCEDYEFGPPSDTKMHTKPH